MGKYSNSLVLIAKIISDLSIYSMICLLTCFAKILSDLSISFPSSHFKLSKVAITYSLYPSYSVQGFPVRYLAKKKIVEKKLLDFIKIPHTCLCVCLFEVPIVVVLKSWKTTSSEDFF